MKKKGEVVKRKKKKKINAERTDGTKTSTWKTH